MQYTVHEDFVFAGFGGQGVMFAGQLLAYTAMNEGFEVTWIPSYGPEMRGGTAHCFVVISSRPIGSPMVQRPKNALIFNNPSFLKYEPLVAPGGLLVRNTSMVFHGSQRIDLMELDIPATATASSLGDLRLTNVVMLGALLTAKPILPIESIRRTLEERLPARHRDLLPLNYLALERGAALAMQVLQTT